MKYTLALFLLPAAVWAQIPPVKGEVITQYSMKYIDVAAGTGKLAEPGKVYVVQYTGWLTDGTKFDSSYDRGEPISFEQGKRKVIPGWDAGFEGMRVGGKRRLLIPYQLAYGEKGRGKIPPKAELIFDVELIDVKDAPAEAGK
ncbi:MAG TPA: FKBP-type peptidyl-prolyl cis-trans isomerase [Bryobacteraceae bacterium]|nr:FKBP-type peptidyl-prolyl cis-trans isomerase [Bryobacteraceae bacterium]